MSGGTEDDRCTNTDKKTVELVKEQMRVEDLLVEIKKIWTRAEHVMRTQDNRCL